MALKIGVFGGTFNPIHNSHIYLSRECARKLELDRIVLAPAFLPPHKPARELADSRDRLEMCRLATRDSPLFQITDFEIRQEGKSYTCKTLRHLSEQYSGADLFLIMGGDMFLTVQDWRLSREIFKMAAICAARRENDGLELLNAHKKSLENEGARCVIIEAEAKPLSSTLIRQMIASGEDASGLVHPDVWRYIVEHGLYKK